jgi:lipopolysaccharide cholinephosphotransferase
MDSDNIRTLQLVELEILDELVGICTRHNLQYFFVGGTLLGAVRHKGFIPWDDDIDIGMPRKDYDKFINICKTELKPDYYCQSSAIDQSFWLLFSKIRKNNTRYIELNNLLYGPKDHCGIYIDIFPFDYCKKKFTILNFKDKLLYKIGNIINLKRQKWMPPIHFYTFLKKAIYSFIPYSLLQLLRKVIITGSDNDGFFISWGGSYGLKKELSKITDIFPLSHLEFEGRHYTVPGNWKKYLTQIYGDYMRLPPEKDRTFHAVTVCFDTNENTV